MPEGKRLRVERDAALCQERLSQVVDRRGTERKKAIMDFLASVIEVTRSATEAADYEEQQ